MATSSSPNMLADAMSRFLDLIVELHEVAVGIHNNHPDVDCDFSRLFTAVSAAVASMQGEEERSECIDALVQTCVKLGQDLLVRLDRVQSFQSTQGANADLRDAWPVAAIEALGDRIQVLQSRYCVFSP
jgi:hypothetical protein